MAARALATYWVPAGRRPDEPYRPVPRLALRQTRAAQELMVLGNYVEVWLAKEGHDGVVGVNYLRKIELPLPSALYGAMLAGVDYVLVGAGSPAEIPELTRTLARHAPVAFSIKVQGARSSDGLGDVRFDPAQVRPDAATALAPLALPRVLAIVASTDLATALAENPDTRPSGFVVEGPSAGGHNAPPRGPRRLDPIGQPVYDDRDVVDLPTLAALGLPYWLARSYGSPERFREALASGAAGIQVGTVFAYCDDSGFDPELVAMVRARVLAGDLQVRADWRASPTGFPFRVVELPGTLTEAAVHEARQPVCDLGALRSAFRREDGGVDYRCPAEPLRAYTRKGGREANTEGRICLCNALFASAGLGQRRPGGLIEPPLVTSGEDLSGVAALLTAARGGTVDSGEFGYTARDVVDYLLS